MITHYLGNQEVEGYSLDLAQRLSLLGDAFPTEWFPLGRSGWKMMQAILHQLPQELVERVNITGASYDRAEDRVSFQPGLDEVSFDERPVLVIDSSVHTGRSMLRLIETLIAAGARNVMSYTLVLKQGAAMVPTYFGMVVEDMDRTFFQLESLPNNRLLERVPFGVLKRISEADVRKVIEPVGAPFDDLAIGDLLYEQETKGGNAYVYEYCGEIAGFIGFRKKGTTLFIDAWGTAVKFRGKGVGHAMLRWAETWARMNKCEAVELWAFHGAIDTYLRYGYDFVEDRWRDLGDGQQFRIMWKPIEYNIKVKPDEVEYR